MTGMKGWLTVKKPVNTWDLEDKVIAHIIPKKYITKALDRIQNLNSIRDLVIKMENSLTD